MNNSHSTNIIPFEIRQQVDGQVIVIYPTLVQLAGRHYLIDCGYAETVDAFEQQLGQLGIGLRDLTGVILTHDDIDHIGGLGELKRRHPGLRIFCSALERPSIVGEVVSERLNQAEQSLPHLPDEHKSWALGFIEKLKNIERLSVDTTFKDGEIWENEMVMVHTPGHTKGHFSLYFPQAGTLIAGDAVVWEHGQLDIANPQFTLDLPKAVESLEKIRQLSPQRLICYHGGVVEGGIWEKLTDCIGRYRP